MYIHEQDMSGASAEFVSLMYPLIIDWCLSSKLHPETYLAQLQLWNTLILENHKICNWTLVNSSFQKISTLSSHTCTWYGDGLSSLARTLLYVVLVVQISYGSQDIHHGVREHRHQDHTHHKVERRLEEDEPFWILIFFFFLFLQQNSRSYNYREVHTSQTSGSGFGFFSSLTPLSVASAASPPSGDLLARCICQALAYFFWTFSG